MKIQYILGILAIAMLLLLGGCAKKAEPTQTTAPTQEAAKAGQLQEVQSNPTEVEKCGTDVVLTYTGCKKQADNTIAVSFINSGRGAIDGVWVYVYGTDGKIGYEEVKETINIKESKTYSIDLAKWVGKLGAVDKIEVGPEKGNTVCANQKQVFRPVINCK